LAAAASWAGAASAAQAAPSGVAEGPLFWLRWAAALGVCLLLAFAGAYALKARQSGALVPAGVLRPGRFRRGAAGLGGGAATFAGPIFAWPSFSWVSFSGVSGASRRGAGAARRLQVVESLRVSPQLEVCLLACDDRELLLATTAQGLVVLKDGPKIAR
jgi:hypothetical protein